MRKIEFVKTVVCDGKEFKAGAVVDAKDVPPDHLACCLRVGYARELPPEPPADPKKK